MSVLRAGKKIGNPLLEIEIIVKMTAGNASSKKWPTSHITDLLVAMVEGDFMRERNEGFHTSAPTLWKQKRRLPEGRAGEDKREANLPLDAMGGKSHNHIHNYLILSTYPNNLPCQFTIDAMNGKLQYHNYLTMSTYSNYSL